MADSEEFPVDPEGGVRGAVYLGEGWTKGATAQVVPDDPVNLSANLELDLTLRPKKPRNVKALLEKLSEFLTENNLEEQIQEERVDIHREIDQKNEEISQKRETHRHKLNEVHEAYKREIQRENQRHLDDLKVTELEISSLRTQLQELEQLNVTVNSKIPCSKSSSSHSDRESVRVRELLECPVCLEEMRPPKKIFQCSNGHVICELCKNNPEVRSCPTCRVKFRGHNVVRNIVAEKLARNTYDSSDSEENMPRPSHTRESNPVEYSTAHQEEFHILGFQPAYGYMQVEEEQEEREREEEEDDFIAWARGIEHEESVGGGAGNQHRRLTDNQQQQQQQADRVSSPARSLTLRDGALLRTYRPNSRYIPHHVRRQRAGREEEEVGRRGARPVELREDEEDGEERLLEAQERMSFRGTRIGRRTADNFRILR